MTDRVSPQAQTRQNEYNLPTADLSSNTPPVKFTVAVTLILWMGLIFVLGAKGTFDTPAAALPPPLLLGVTGPILIFLGLFWTAGSFRDFVLAADLRLVTGVQAWRFLGFGFLALYAHGLLPGLFAWPAGLGDMAIAMTAPWVVVALVQRPAFAASKGFVTWHLLGLLDFAVALGTGVLASSAALGLGGAVTTDPLGRLPLVLVPCYLVPLFTMLHLTAILQARRARPGHPDRAAKGRQ
jgi:hypothetical protein